MAESAESKQYACLMLMGQVKLEITYIIQRPKRAKTIKGWKLSSRTDADWGIEIDGQIEKWCH